MFYNEKILCIYEWIIILQQKEICIMKLFLFVCILESCTWREYKKKYSFLPGFLRPLQYDNLAFYNLYIILGSSFTLICSALRDSRTSPERKTWTPVGTPCIALQTFVLGLYYSWCSKCRYLRSCESLGSIWSEHHSSYHLLNRFIFQI